MPSKKKKYNARFPAGRIKKIMQTDEQIGKVAQAVPVIISRTLELFVESLLKRAMQITSAKNAKTLTPTHMKQCILSESRFDFLKDLVKGIPDVSSGDDDFGTGSGNLSPGTPLSGRAYGSYSCFQFLQSTDSSSSRSSGPPSQSSPLLQPTQPKFYKEIPIGSEEFNRSDENSAPSIVYGVGGGGAGIQQLANHCPPLPPVIKADGNAGNAGNSTLLRTISGRNITQLNELKLSSNCIKTSDYRKPSSDKGGGERGGDDNEDDDDDDEDGGEGEEVDGKQQQTTIEENGYHVSKTCIIDEDYDT